MGRKLTIAWMMLMTVLPMAAQDMSIEGFARQKDSMLGLQKMKKDKKQATLLLTPGETRPTARLILRPRKEKDC